jgi:hypothetical protein
MSEKPAPRRRAKTKTPKQKADRVEKGKSETLTKRSGSVRKTEPVDARARQRARDRAG